MEKVLFAPSESSNIVTLKNLLFFPVLFFLLINDSYSQVQLVEEKLDLPTYKMGPDVKQALFKDYTYPGFVVFRGDRSVYPYTLQENFTRQKTDISYNTVRLENNYIKTYVIPDLRGRLQGAFDKRNGWDFIYYNEVIKPADIAVRKAWLAGGLEWNHPGGHGYTQLDKLSYVTKEYPDGSKSVVVAEIEPVRQMKWETEIKLHPNKLYIETIGRLYSIAPYPVPFASSLNGAMHISPELEVVYPQGSFVTGHGKNDVRPWPFVNDSTDARWFKNLLETFSVFVEGEGLNEDYWGCYSHDDSIDAGTVIVADHRDAPGKKYFTWGSHAKGRRWDTLLSDKNGGYIELQVQAFWDNLGYGYAWIDPLEVKEFTVYWYPIKNMGGFVKATKDVCLNLKQVDKSKIKIAVQATHPILKSQIVIIDQDNETVIYNQSANLTIESPWVDEFELPSETYYENLKLEIIDASNQSLITYKTKPGKFNEPDLPIKHNSKEESTIDQLLAKGKSFYQDPFSPEAESYYKAILSCDLLESRANKEMGLIQYYRGNLNSAEKYLKTSLLNDHLNESYQTNYYLGLVFLEKNALDSAANYFEVAGRQKQYKGLSSFNLGKIALKEKKYNKAKSFFEEALNSGEAHPYIYSYLAFANRHLNQYKQAKSATELSLSQDALSFTAMLENYFLSDLKSFSEELHLQFDRNDSTFIGSHLYTENALFYMEVDAWDEAIQILENGLNYYKNNNKAVYPVLHYYLGYCYDKLNKNNLMLKQFEKGSNAETKYVFPYHRYSRKILETAVTKLSDDATGWMYLGNLYAYYRRHQDAIEAWEKSIALKPGNSLVLHNLAGANWYLDQDTAKTLYYLEQALEHDKGDKRLIMELDHLYQAFDMPLKRADLFKRYEPVITDFDELVMRYVRFSLENQKFDKAIELMETTYFFPKEINNKKQYIHTLYAESHLGKAEELIEEGNYKNALNHIKKSRQYPSNLNDIWPARKVETRPNYLEALVYAGMGNDKKAQQIWMKIIEGNTRIGSESEYYRGLALRKTGKNEKSDAILHALIDENLRFLKESNDEDKLALANYLIGKAYDALNQKVKADKYLERAFNLKSDVIVDARIEATYIPKSELN